MTCQYVTTLENSPFKYPARNRVHASLADARRYADQFNMGSDYGHMSVFTIEKQLQTA